MDPEVILYMYCSIMGFFVHHFTVISSRTIEYNTIMCVHACVLLHSHPEYNMWLGCGMNHVLSEGIHMRP